MLLLLLLLLLSGLSLDRIHFLAEICGKKNLTEKVLVAVSSAARILDFGIVAAAAGAHVRLCKQRGSNIDGDNVFVARAD